MIVTARVHILEFPSFEITALGIRTTEQETLDFVRSIERIPFRFVLPVRKSFQHAAHICAIRCSVLVDHVPKHENLAGPKNVSRRPIKRAPVHSYAQVALTLCGKAADR